MRVAASATNPPRPAHGDGRPVDGAPDKGNRRPLLPVRRWPPPWRNNNWRLNSCACPGVGMPPPQLTPVSTKIGPSSFHNPMKIAELKDPALFQDLVRKLMLAEHGSAYQVVDDSGGDGGLDGF